MPLDKLANMVAELKAELQKDENSSAELIGKVDEIIHGLHSEQERRANESDKLAEMQEVLNSYLARDFSKEVPLTQERMDFDALALSVNYFGVELKQAFADLEEKNNELFQANEQIKTLFKEVHHRVKNNLQVLTSLIRLQSSSITDQSIKDVFLESQNRIHTMGLIHKMLYQDNSMSTVNLNEYLSELVRNLASCYTPTPEDLSTDLQIEDISTNINFAIPVGLLVNEIVTNSIKHAIQEGGSLYVHLQRIGKKDFLLSIGDHGGEDVHQDEPSEQVSLGRELITDLIEQMDGELSYDTTRKGYHYRIILPVPVDEAEAAATLS